MEENLVDRIRICVGDVLIYQSDKINIIHLILELKTQKNGTELARVMCYDTFDNSIRIGLVGALYGRPWVKL